MAPSKKTVQVAPWVSLGITEEEYKKRKQEDKAANTVTEPTKETPVVAPGGSTDVYNSNSKEAPLTNNVTNDNNQIIQGIDNKNLAIGAFGLLVLYKLFN